MYAAGVAEHTDWCLRLAARQQIQYHRRMDHTAPASTTAPGLPTPVEGASGPQIRHYAALPVEEDSAKPRYRVAALMLAADPVDAGAGIAAVSELLGASQWTIYRWLQGTHQPMRVLADAIDRAFTALPPDAQTAPSRIRRGREA